MLRTSVLSILLLFGYCGGVKLEQPIAMVASSSFDDALPYALLEGKTWKAEPSATYVKLHLYFDQEIPITGVRIQSCDTLARNVSAFINFDEHTESIPAKDKEANLDFKKKVGARSLTLNFNNLTPLCLQTLSVLGPSGAYKLIPPRVEQGRVTASSTLKPALSYDIMNLFDSRMEYSWSSDGKGAGESIRFDFANPVKITKLRLWNGYQRSDSHCQANSRLKKARLTGDNGYDQVIEASDTLGGQEIVLPKEFSGKSLTLKVEEVFAGNLYKDLVLSELRFFDSERWFVVDPRQTMERIADSNQGGFAKADLDFTLKSTLRMQSQNQYGNWLLRFRKDGSFYLEGDWSGSGEMGHYYALGSYEIKSSSRADGLNLRIFGLLREQKNPMMGMDCNGCGRDCNRPDPGQQFGQKEGIFEDYILLKKTENGVTLENTAEKPRIQFERLEMQAVEKTANL